MKINRCVVILKYKQPFVDWINSMKSREVDDKYTLEQLSDDSHPLYLLDKMDPNDIDKYVKKNYKFFIEALFGRYTDLNLFYR